MSKALAVIDRISKIQQLIQKYIPGARKRNTCTFLSLAGGMVTSVFIMLKGLRLLRHTVAITNINGSMRSWKRFCFREGIPQ